jgi:hypothetical protein
LHFLSLIASPAFYIPRTALVVTHWLATYKPVTS